MLRSILCSATIAAACALAGLAGQSTATPHPTRPAIVGVAHIGLKVNDIKAADHFYGDVLGYDHFSLDKPTGGLMLNYYKVNDHQYIEIFPGLESASADRLSHIAFETSNIQQLRDYLDSRGVKVPQTLKPGLDKNVSMMLKDPDGHNVEFVQYMPGSLHENNFGKLLSSRRISSHIIHVGVTIQDRAAADRFYKEILGFKLTWQGGKTDDVVDWVDMQVPDGTDWVEYMLNAHNPTPKQLGVHHHLALGVDSVKPGYDIVKSRGYEPPQPPKIGRDGKWQLNMYDPDLTRSELMDFKPSATPCCYSTQ